MSAINYTVGPHARRCFLLCQKAFGIDAKIGVIALEDRDYDPLAC
jgi:hypothetical protein